MKPFPTTLRNVYTTIILSTIVAVAFLGFAGSATKEIKRLNTLVAGKESNADNKDFDGDKPQNTDNGNEELQHIIDSLMESNKEIVYLNKTLTKEKKAWIREKEILIKQVNGGKEVETKLSESNNTLSEATDQLMVMQGKLDECRDEVTKWRTAYNNCQIEVTKWRNAYEGYGNEVNKWRTAYDNCAEKLKKCAGDPGNSTKDGVYMNNQPAANKECERIKGYYQMARNNFFALNARCGDYLQKCNDTAYLSLRNYFTSK